MLKEYLAGGRSGSGAAAEGGAAGGQAAGVFLEVASGTGQHCAHFAAGLTQLTFQPTEYAEEDMSRCEQGMVGRRRRCAHACACAGWNRHACMATCFQVRDACTALRHAMGRLTMPPHGAPCNAKAC